jgi:hypothetical protein
MGDHNAGTGFGGGSFGPDGFWTATTNTWAGNIWDDTGGTVAASTQT